uniref:NADH-ubiquinone oxidoreductase chain 2 n=1 Tax=Iwatanemertes piperata TaxID=1432319 RepID=W5RSC0_9BILA|nr:NADH dehydrogenase subunit 2 [Iwatanemertes piperata]AHB53115.1 NADH dehydrogenase subunit 2 [Iwatanemertes piperata]
MLCWEMTCVGTGAANLCLSGLIPFLSFMVLGFPFLLGFGFLCVVGSLMSVSASHWLGVWVGLELNLMGFLPLVVQGGDSQFIEGSIKYFVVQALGSSLLLLGGFLHGSLFFSWGWGSGSFLVSILLLGLLLKLGAAPFHWWVPSVMGGLSWLACGLLATWQKLAPFFLLFGVLSDFFYLFLFFACVSSLVGGVGGVGQVQLRVLMGYSSINHLGWMIGLLVCSLLGGMCYFLFYFFISFLIFFVFSGSGLWRVSQVSSGVGLFVLIGLVSLGGLPPLSGFVPKWVALQVVSSAGQFFLGSMLIVGALISLYYYLSLVFLLFVDLGTYYDLCFMVGRYFRLMGLGFVFFCFGFPLYEMFVGVM